MLQLSERISTLVHTFYFTQKIFKVKFCWIYIKISFIDFAYDIKLKINPFDLMCLVFKHGIHLSKATKKFNLNIFFHDQIIKWKNSVCVYDFSCGHENQSHAQSLSPPLSWEQNRPKWTQYAAHSSLLVFRHFLNLFDIFNSTKPPSSSHSQPALSPHRSCLYRAPWPISPPSSPAGVPAEDHCLRSEQTGCLQWSWPGSIPPISPFAPRWAWWQCWHSTCKLVGLIKSVALI